MEALLEVHLHEYSTKAKSLTSELTEIWTTLELEEDERQQELDKVFKSVDSSWESAFAAAHQRKLRVVSNMEAMQREISATQEQLGEANAVCVELQAFHHRDF